MNTSQLSPNTKAALSALVEAVRDGHLAEDFQIVWSVSGAAFHSSKSSGFISFEGVSIQHLHIEALEAAGLIFTRQHMHDGRESSRECYITPAGYALVDAGFESPQNCATETPIEIRDSLAAFLRANPSVGSNCFLMMRFGSTALHDRLVTVIREALAPYEITVHRADDREYHEDLYLNILTYIHGCSFGIAIFERIEMDDFNPNVSLEVGIMTGLGKKVCLVKDKNLKTLHTDLVGKLYKAFDPIEPEKTLPTQLRAWLKDKEIIRLPSS